MSASTDTTSDVTCQVYRQGQPARRQQALGQISTILHEPGTLVWLDIVDPGEHDLDLLQQEFHLHPLAIEDAIQAHERPKIEPFGQYWFLVVRGVTYRDPEIVFHELAIFAGRNFVVTVRHNPPYPLEEVQRRFEMDSPHLRKGSGFLLYTLLDTMVDGYFPVAESIEERVDGLEDILFLQTPLRREVLPEIFHMKREAHDFRRAVFPMRDILNPIIRRDLDLFGEDVAVYFRDVYDHAVRIIDHLDTLRDLVSSALEIHLSVVANQQNEVAKQLTMVATIFLPLSFIVGFFGQNFNFLVGHIGGPLAFFTLGLGVEVLAVALTVVFFKVRGWF